MSLLPMDDHLYTTGRCSECGGPCQPRYERCDTCLVRIARCFNAVDRAAKARRAAQDRPYSTPLAWDAV